MRISCIMALALLCAIGIHKAQAAKTSEKCYLVKNGKMLGHLFVPRKIGRPIMLAMQELREYFHKMTGAELPVSWRSPELRHRKDIGVQLVVRDESEWMGKESAQAFTIEATPKATKNIPITGVTITGNTEIAVLYGVYEYLQELGVSWFTPGEIGENVPKLKNIVISKRKKLHSPSFLERGLNLSGIHKNHFDVSDGKRYKDIIHHEYELWLLRNRVAFQRYISRDNWFDFNKTAGSGGHGIRVVLKGVDPKKHPECFPFVTRNHIQKRRFKHGQICFTNQKNIQRAIELAVMYFKKQEESKEDRNSDLDEVMDSFPIGLADTTGICECANCAKTAGKPPYSRDRLVWHFMNSVAKGLNKKMPGKKISLFVPYCELSRPPKDVKIEPNIVAVNCRIVSWRKNPEDKPYYPFTSNYSEDVKAIRDAGAEMRIYNYSTWRGCPQPLNILDAAVGYKKLGYKHYHLEVMERNEQNWPMLWSIAQFIWNSDESPKKLLSEYCDGYYGKAGQMVLGLLKEMDANSRKMPMFIYGGVVGTHVIMSDDFIAVGRKQLASAIKKAKGKKKTRLELFRDTFEMFSQTAETYREYCRALNLRTPEAIAVAKKKFAEYEKLWKTKNLAKICSPRTLQEIKRLSRAEITAIPKQKRRKELEAKTSQDKEWLKDLFAFEKTPQSIPNLFPLPEVWKFKLDYKNIGLSQGWETLSYDDAKEWNSISTWNFFEPQGYKNIDGRFWYRMKFKAPNFPAGKKVILRIGSLDDAGDIYINGKLACSRKFGESDNWQSSFAFDATRYIIQGKENLIAVRGFDSFGAGGIWRPCALYTD